MYLDAWVFKQINIGAELEPPLTRQALDLYNQKKRMELVAFLMEKSPFYQRHLANIISHIDSTSDILDLWNKIPFTSSKDLINEGEQMLCVHPGEISRVVTQTTSGSTGPSKRIFFTPEDQELTIDYFHNGMKIMLNTADKVLILLPHKSPGSLGLLLEESLSRLGAQSFFMDYLDNKKNTSKDKLKKVTSIVGPPSLIIDLTKKYPGICPHSVLMTADFVSENDRKTVKDIWGSKVFEHYGMTEMGLGCAMSCRDTEETPPVGYHVRENDLYIEIIDPSSGKILPQGEWGEIVMTTLTRKGMPFLRYCTGDTGRWLKDTCTCGSVLKRLDRVQKRTTIKNINT